jgi:16S rRNA (uracil1498-N3)-methyltransferase
VDRLNMERLRAHMVEAAEQCGRTSLPELVDMVNLGDLLTTWPEHRTLFFADEALTGTARAFAGLGGGTSAAILVGPEGGFLPEEAAAIRRMPRSRPVSLGPRILRADTAAIAAIAAWQARQQA